MEKALIEGGGGVSTLLAGLLIVFSLHLVAKLAHWIWDYNNNKHDVTEEAIDNLTKALATNLSAIHSLEERMRSTENQFQEFNKFKIDLRLLIQAIKELAGDRWQDIRKIIMEDKFPT